MEFGNPKLPRGPFETSKGPGCDKDSSELSFRVPSIPSSSPIIATTSQSESENPKVREFIDSTKGR